MPSIEFYFLAAIPIFVFLINIKYYFIDTTPTDPDEIKGTWFSKSRWVLCPKYIMYFILPIAMSKFGYIYWALALVMGLGLFITCDVNKYIWHKIKWFRWFFIIMTSSQAMILTYKPNAELLTLYTILLFVAILLSYNKLIKLNPNA